MTVWQDASPQNPKVISSDEGNFFVSKKMCQQDDILPWVIR